MPLSDQAPAVLGEARRKLAHNGGLVFPSSRKGRMQGHHPMGRLIKALDIAAVPHGIRSSFQDWAVECAEAPREVCELVLDHARQQRVARQSG